VQQGFVPALNGAGGSGNGMMIACWELLDREGGANPTPGITYP